MAAFGIVGSEFASSDEHYFGEDEVLYEWLIANNYKESDRESHYIVDAPTGYVFYSDAYNETLYPKGHPDLEGKDEGISTFSYVTAGSSENDKALMLMAGPTKFMEPAAFYSLNIPEDRILEYMIY